MQSIRPVEIHVERTREVRIRWSDGVETVWPLAELRKHCPCATCRHERETAASNPLRLVKPVAEQAAMATVDSAELVGNYALRIVWKDGHATGIYDYNTLRRPAQPGTVNRD